MRAARPSDSTALHARLADLFARALPRPGEGDERVSPSQLACLRYVETHPGCTVTEVAAGLEISNPAATKLVDRLEARGLVARLPRSGDRRQVRLAPTPGGRQLLLEATRRREQALRRILERMDPADRGALEAGLRGFLRAALQDPGDLERMCLHCGTEHVSWCPLNELHLQLTGQPLPPPARPGEGARPGRRGVPREPDHE